MNNNAYLEKARNLLRAPTTGGQRQVNLRCSLDSIYIGVLQFLAASCADAIIGEPDRGSEPSAWRTVYRAALRSADEYGLSNVDTSWLARRLPSSQRRLAICTGTAVSRNGSCE